MFLYTYAAGGKDTQAQYQAVGFILEKLEGGGGGRQPLPSYPKKKH